MSKQPRPPPWFWNGDVLAQVVVALLALLFAVFVGQRGAVGHAAFWHSALERNGCPRPARRLVVEVNNFATSRSFKRPRH